MTTAADGQTLACPREGSRDAAFVEFAKQKETVAGIILARHHHPQTTIYNHNHLTTTVSPPRSSHSLTSLASLAHTSPLRPPHAPRAESPHVRRSPERPGLHPLRAAAQAYQPLVLPPTSAFPAPDTPCMRA
ncbi:uncharacterized protein K452DRAFT_56192 [Aplosporella prunicola CBS 121167]|uniref:Uncharacterized protein n=1 Tax=Aplosporella prunicola CBS 121167 TaxID=1176127 RepID=A0A6A6BA63_9PEZI|nr:uncharacterized protein K452DRAFT_56192 [Aplosporella prunicola CBS 121167]KAF2139797.1 hypothetical protein K452DRAFT_56192 [Aplosporella prunicola CBS 121167]